VLSLLLPLKKKMTRKEQLAPRRLNGSGLYSLKTVAALSGEKT
jgi:hypothetical protein